MYNRNHEHRKNSPRKRDRYHSDHARGHGIDDLGIVSMVNNDSNKSGPQRSVEGWIVFVTGVHEEAQEEDIRDMFAEYGTINSIRVNLNSLTGFCKGYALIEYTKKSEAQDAINTLHGTELLGQTINVDWAFVGGGSADDVIRPNKKVKGRRR